MHKLRFAEIRLEMAYLVRDILTFPLVVYDELQQGEYESLLISGVALYYVVGIPQAYDSATQLAIGYVLAGAIVVATKYLTETA